MGRTFIWQDIMPDVNQAQNTPMMSQTNTMLFYSLGSTLDSMPPGPTLLLDINIYTVFEIITLEYLYQNDNMAQSISIQKMSVSLHH